MNDGSPVISPIPEAPMHSACDVWGNIRLEPSYIVEERHGDYFCNILVYCVDGLFYYGFQLKIGTTIRQAAANINGRAFTSSNAARSAASIEIEAECNKNKNTKKFFAEFTIIRYNQGSLFEGVNDG
ncbi:hypothetical protein AGMMS50268_09340 [Spirochaetia bacterium]|nr:hypothetical protein AGMMS50268_09340 [Spirochaetia bacterium]